ncbi:MAG: hypothetical protein ACJ8CR_01925 [Roseiflexaceae bacterium]
MWSGSRTANIIAGAPYHTTGMPVSVIARTSLLLHSQQPELGAVAGRATRTAIGQAGLVANNHDRQFGRTCGGNRFREIVL